MRNRTVGLVWAAGLTLAAIVYLMGPDAFLDAAFTWSDRVAYAVQQAVQHAGARAYDMLRALAIACFAVFFLLCMVAAGRGLPARWMLVVVTLLFLLLVWHEGPEATGHWLMAFVLAATGAASMTRRLTVGPRPPMP